MGIALASCSDRPHLGSGVVGQKSTPANFVIVPSDRVQGREGLEPDVLQSFRAPGPFGLLVSWPPHRALHRPMASRPGGTGGMQAPSYKAGAGRARLQSGPRAIEDLQAAAPDAPAEARTLGYPRAIRRPT